jgi:hypothetical protein
VSKNDGDLAWLYHMHRFDAVKEALQREVKITDGPKALKNYSQKKPPSNEGGLLEKYNEEQLLAAVELFLPSFELRPLGIACHRRLLRPCAWIVSRE